MPMQRGPYEPIRSVPDIETGGARFRRGEESAFGRGMRELERRYEGSAPHGRPYRDAAYAERPAGSAFREDRTAARARDDANNRGPKGYRRSDARIWEEVCEALTRDETIDASEIEVHVEGGVVTLRGIVEERRDKRAAEAIAAGVRGVHDVMNEIRIDREPAGKQPLF